MKRTAVLDDGRSLASTSDRPGARLRTAGTGMLHTGVSVAGGHRGQRRLAPTTPRRILITRLGMQNPQTVRVTAARSPCARGGL